MIITIRNLRAKTLLGVYPHERTQKRDILVTMKLTIDAPNAASTDALSQTLDYDAVEKAVLEYLDKSEAQLVETVVSGILDVLKGIALLREAEVTIDKPGALKHADSVAVTGHRSYH